MNDEIKKLLEGCHLDHVAIAVESLKESQKFYEMLGLKFVHEEEVGEQQVKTSFAYLDEKAKLELLETTHPDGPIGKYIRKKGPGLHHICFRVKDISQKQKELVGKGLHFLYGEPKKGAGGCLVNFIHPKSSGGVLVELSEKISM